MPVEGHTSKNVWTEQIGLDGACERIHSWVGIERDWIWGELGKGG